MSKHDPTDDQNDYGEALPADAFTATPPKPNVTRGPLAKRTYCGRDIFVMGRGNEARAYVEDPSILIADKPLFARLPIYYYHGSGHSWGYMGSGPAQLALDLLLDATDEWPDRKALNKGFSRAWHMHQDFKSEVLVHFDQGASWVLPGVLVEAWIAHWEHRHGREVHELNAEMQLDTLLAEMAKFEVLAERGETWTPAEQARYEEVATEIKAIEDLLNPAE